MRRALLALTVPGLSLLCACPPEHAGPAPSPTTSAVCGNDRQQGAEVCDGTDLDDMTCGQLGFGAGALACKPSCRDFDRAGCGAPSTCGDGSRNGVELCDGSDLGGTLCEALGLGPGTLGCLPNCGDYDTSGCAPPPDCGDGRINGAAEVCDGDNLDGLSCVRLGYAAGELRCAADCLSLDRTGCVRADAGATDLASADHAATDAAARSDLAIADRSAVDAGAPDAQARDVALVDTGTADATTPDTALACAPSQPYCVDTYTRATCNAQGTGPASTQSCDATGGQMCNPSTGLCLSACQVAAATPSSYGCDYRFAVTHNQLAENLGAGGDVFPAAVVVSSVSQATARITLRDRAGSVVAASGPRHLVDSNPGSTLAPVDISSTLVGGGVSTTIDGVAINQLELDPGEVATILLPDAVIRGTSASGQSFHLASTQPVSAQLFNPICCNFAYTNDASLLMPTTTWGRAYYAVSTAHRTWTQGIFDWTQDEATASPAGLSVLAAEDGTQVAIRLRPGQSAADFATASGVPLFGADARYPDQLRITLSAGQVLQLATAFGTSGPDPTGVLIAASKPVGVFGTHECAYVPEQTQACDHLEEMLPPIETWGSTHVAAMVRQRNPVISSTNKERLYYRLQSASDGNRVTLTPRPSDLQPAQAASAPTCTLDAAGSLVLDDGQSCELGSRDSFVIQAQGPLSVATLFVGQVATGLEDYGHHGGDPALSVLVPVEQWRAWYTVLAPEHYFDRLLTVVYRTGTLLYLDGVAVAPQTAGPVGPSELVETERAIGSTRYLALTLRLSPGSHRIWSRPASAPGSGELDVLDPGPRFAVMSYGYDDFVSYALPGGSDLRSLVSYTDLPPFD